MRGRGQYSKLVLLDTLIKITFLSPFVYKKRTILLQSVGGVLISLSMAAEPVGG